ARVLSLSLEHPGWSCVKLSDYLRLEQVQVSSPTIQKLLAKHGMASKYERMLRLEEKHLREGMELNADQIAMIEKLNPVFTDATWSHPNPANCSAGTPNLWVP